MILITTALMLEARPIRERMELRAHGDLPFPVYSSDKAILVVTGTGSLKAAAATGWALGHFPGIRAAMNIGFAGAPERVSPLHRWHYIHSVRDQSTGRLCMPDILYKHPFPEAPLLTVPKPVQSDIGWEGLVDMEGSGFFEAARHFLSPDRIVLLKWISDHFSSVLDTTFVRQAFSGAIDAPVDFLENWPAGREEPRENDEVPVLESVRARLRLSRTQTLFLEKWVRGFLARGGEPSQILEALPAERPSGKEDNNRHFEELRDVLKG